NFVRIVFPFEIFSSQYRRLQQYLNGDFTEPVEVLCRFWQDQKDAISYKELRQAVSSGTISYDTIDLWMQDYAVLVSGKFRGVWADAMKAGADGQPILDGKQFNMQAPGTENWIRNRAAQFVTECTEEQQSAIAALLEKKMRDNHTVDELARMIRPCIGLTTADAKAVMRYYDNIVATYRNDHPRMRQDSIRQRARDAAQKYAERKHRQRALTIAQTESAFAYNKGADEGIRQAQEQNLIGEVKKRWSTSGDDGVCDICAALEGVEIDMDGAFGFKGRVLFAGQKRLPPAHPRCACAVEYIEIGPAVGRDAVLGASDKGEQFNDSDLEPRKLGQIDIDKVDEALSYYEDLFRNDPVENMLVIDNLGNVYYAKGDASGVSMRGIDFRGAYVTHNHPESNGILSFGSDDFIFLREHPEIAELRCVNKEYDYAVSVLKDMSKVVYNDIYREAWNYSEEEGFEAQDKAMEILQERGYVRYVRKKII
ncbi:MAG: phage head morphogenesis protein, partial [Clostridium sp.]|nr:phage head morphogenesis protein [Clostridium sp.]